MNAPEMITPALRKLVKEGKHDRLRGDISSDLHGYISSGLHGDISGLRGYISGLSGYISSDLRGYILAGKYPLLHYIQPTAEEIERLDAVREVVLAQPKRLNMGIWHGEKWDYTHTPEEEHSCHTPHCLAGWLQALSPDAEIRKMSPQGAGKKLAPFAAGLFFSDNETVMDFLENRRYAPKSA